MVLTGLRIKEEFIWYFYYFLILLGIIFIIIILWYLYNHFIFKCNGLFKNLPISLKYFPSKPHFAKDKLEIDVYNKNDEISNNYKYTVASYIYIMDWKYKYFKNKDFLKKGEKSIEIFLEKELNNLVFRIYHTNGSKDFKIKNVDINRWFHFILMVQSEQVDLYYNGKLYSSNILDNLPKMNNYNITLCDNGGFNGLIYNFKYVEKSISLVTVNKWNKNKLPLEEKFFKINN